MASTKRKEKQLGSVATFWNEGKGDPGTSLASENKKWFAVRTFGWFMP